MFRFGIYAAPVAASGRGRARVIALGVAKAIDRNITERYERLGVLGRGGQGTVYRARDRWMQREVAIKVLDSNAARDPHVSERLVREQRALSALKGTAAVEVLDICRSNGGELCLVMELLAGTDLENHLYSVEDRHERIQPSWVADRLEPIVETLEVAHGAGILHRDLKPANIFLLDDGSVRLLDFGMARLRRAAPLTAAGTCMGSPSFMAPESWQGQSERIDQRVDVYSLGVILFRVLAGELPFTGTSLQQKFMGATQSARPSLFAHRPDLPRDADEWVATALAIDPDQRFRNVRALWNAFIDVFEVKAARRRSQRAAFWAAAKRALHIAPAEASSAPAPPQRGNVNAQAEAPEKTDQTSTAPESSPASAPSQAITSAELEAVSISSLADSPTEKPSERTLELSSRHLAPLLPPRRMPPPPPGRKKKEESTLEVDEIELESPETR
ncbi:MAG TPA: serine/threonine-protein kinase [Polyangiaceae bacterium]|nr:serine/threonine-protein kinase [Polyangiaceae bacterium]